LRSLLAEAAADGNIFRITTHSFSATVVHRRDGAIDGEAGIWLSFANSLEEPSDQKTVEPVSTRLHLRDYRANDGDQLQLFCIGQNPQRPDHIDSKLDGGTPGTNLVDQQLRASLLGKGDRFALSFVHDARQAVYD
jgi:hypothetical protein